MEIYKITLPAQLTSPVVLSIPHCGTSFPEELVGDFKGELLPPDDTDWFVDQLYRFASDLGMMTISAMYSRWVIDLNRNPENIPLYDDGRVITALCTTTDFSGMPVYRDERSVVDPIEVYRRKSLYFDPYHQKVQELLNITKANFGKALLWDCHSIRRKVPAIAEHPFPDLVLGSVDGTSASPELTALAAAILASSGLNVQENHPFKGGYITRSFGRPQEGQHALQLEMSKDKYMDDAETAYSESRAAEMQELLRETFIALNRELDNY